MGIQLQVGATELFKDIIKRMLIWLDDWVLHSKTFEEHIELLEKFLGLSLLYDFTLSPEKTNLLTKRAKWCGRKITAEGITLDPRRIEGLLSMQRPDTAGDLQQFLCALNWMRNGLAAYTKMTAPLKELLQSLMAKHGAKKVRLEKVPLDDSLWTKELQTQFEVIKTQIAGRVELTHLVMTQQLCLQTDSSGHFHAAVLTQVPKEDLGKPQSAQHHSPLEFVSGAFKDASSRGSIFEKEAFAIVHAMSRLDYLTACSETSIFTDHRNLVFIFDPLKVQPNMPYRVAVPAYLVSKVQRWALILSQFEYCIAQVPGELNYFPDRMTRWGAQWPKSRRLYIPVPQAQTELRISTFHDQITEAQGSLTPAEKKTIQKSSTMTNVYTSGNKVYITIASDKLKLSILVMAHCGEAGHWGQEVTLKRIQSYLTWKGLRDDVRTFVQKCIHCEATKGSIRVPRQMSHTLHATEPNQILYFDYLYMGAGENGYKYILILKDDFSSYVWLVPAKAADRETTVKTLVEWMSAFGTCDLWVSD